MEVLIFIGIIIIVFIYMVSNKRTDSKQTELEPLLSSSEETNCPKDSSYDNDITERFYNLRDAILEGKQFNDNTISHPVTGSLIFSHRMMTTLKPEEIHEHDMDYLSNVNSSTDFCALSIFRLENYSASACRAGLVKVTGGKVEKETQVDFKPYKLTKKTQKELGEDKVRQLMSFPEFPVIWNEIKSFMDSQIVVVYDMGYESGILRYLFDKYHIDFKPLSFIFAIGKTQQRFHHYLAEKELNIKEDECLLISKLIASIELDGELTREDLSMLKKKMYRKL